MKVIKLLKDLIKIPSPSGNERRKGEFLFKRLKKNFNAKIQKVGNRFNILATTGKPLLILTTHMDTVPKQLEIKEDCLNIYGRGTCDANGPLTAMICAGEKAVKQGIKNFGLLFDVSEETDFSGIKQARKLVNPKITIVGEPTNFQIRTGQKGLLGIKIKCYGKSAHGSTPEKGKSAIEELIKILTKIKKINLPKDKNLGKTTLNIGTIKGGSAVNIIANYAEAFIEIRTTTENKKILKLLSKKISKKKYKIEYSFEPVFTKKQKCSILNKLKFKKTTSTGFTEMYFWAKKSKTIVFGPGKNKFAHTDNERISKKDLIRGTKEYFKMIKILTKELEKEKVKQNKKRIKKHINYRKLIKNKAT